MTNQTKLFIGTTIGVIGILILLIAPNWQPLDEPMGASISAPSSASGLVGYWSLDADDLYDTDIFQDLSGNGNNGTSANTPVYANDQAGTPNQAMVFNGTTDVVDCGSDTTIDNIFDSGGTISAWIYPESDGEGNNGHILRKGNGWALLITADDGTNCEIEFYQFFDGADGYWDTAKSIPLSDWTYVSVSYDNGATTNNPTIYVNGISVAITEEGTPTGARDSDVGGDLIIGNNAGVTRTFDGSISDAMLFSSTLTEDQVMQLYLSGRTTAKIKMDVCPDDMVYVGHDWTWQGTYWAKEYFCIDKYEASNGGGAYYVDINGNGNVTDTAVDVYGDGTTFNETTATAKAVSEYNATPWVTINQVNAKAACMAAGKHLATNYELLLAAKGTPDPDTSDPGDDSEECNIWTNSKPSVATWSVTNQAIKTGTATSCVSDAGAYDLIGNVWEWTDNVINNGLHPATGASLPAQSYITGLDVYGLPTTTGSSTADYNYDHFWINATGYRGFLRGGSWSNASSAGLFALYLNYAPSSPSNSIGFRCAK